MGARNDFADFQKRGTVRLHRPNVCFRIVRKGFLELLIVANVLRFQLVLSELFSATASNAMLPRCALDLVRQNPHVILVPLIKQGPSSDSQLAWLIPA